MGWTSQSVCGPCVARSYPCHKAADICGLFQWFIGLTALVLLSLAFLGMPSPVGYQTMDGVSLTVYYSTGFTDIAEEWPLNDKLLHFICFTMATAVFYFVIDVDE